MKRPTSKQIVRLTEAFDESGRGQFDNKRIDCSLWHYITKDDEKSTSTMVSMHFPKEYLPSFQFHFDIFLQEWKNDVGLNEQ